MLCYSWPLEKADNGSGEFYYSKDYVTWTKANTPSGISADSWNISFFKWNSSYFSISPEETSSNTYKVFYTKNMKDYDSISKDYAVTGSDRDIDISEDDNKYIAEEQGHGTNAQLVISERSKKAGSKWKTLINYKGQNVQDFKYDYLSYIGGGIVFLKDGNLSRMYSLKNGKSFSTAIDATKFNIYYEAINEVYFVSKAALNKAMK